MIPNLAHGVPPSTLVPGILVTTLLLLRGARICDRNRASVHSAPASADGAVPASDRDEYEAAVTGSCCGLTDHFDFGRRPPRRTRSGALLFEGTGSCSDFADWLPPSSSAG